MFLGRKADLQRIRTLFRTFPVVGILGPRQIGKTTWAMEIARGREPKSARFDLEKPADLARLADPSAMDRFWRMIAHGHGQVLNSSELGRSFAVSDSTVRRYLDLLQGTFMARVLQPWSENLGKRQVKAPKVYVAGPGFLHVLLGIRTQEDLQAHPKVGASFEGFALEQVVRRLGVDWEECYFWGTHQGAELDLLVVRGRTRLGFEFKHTDAPGVTPSMRMALKDLKLHRLDVVHRGRETFPLGERIRAVPISRVMLDIQHLA